jgi:prephenate dehydrogenase
MAAPFRRVAVLGVGLVGGSFALALKRAFPDALVVGWDRPEVLDRARDRGAIDEFSAHLTVACQDADLVYVALPVVGIIEQLPAIAAAAPPAALVTDSGSTKAAICRAAQRAFPSPENFVGGHPVAGREHSGIENADADLFRAAPYALIAPVTAKPVAQSDDRVQRLLAVVEAIGALPVWIDADSHDRLAAYLSHLPQMAAIALAVTVLEGAGEKAASLAGPGLRDTLRLAGSPYGVWTDICRTNSHLAEALDRLRESLEQIRTRLQSEDLRDDFARSNHLYKMLRKLE